MSSAPPPDRSTEGPAHGTPRSPRLVPDGATPTFDSEAVTLASTGDQLPQLRPARVPGDLGAFGGHRVIRLLGRGGMGAVYEAVDTVLGRPVALKLMLPAQAASPAGRERFLREARAAAAIRHENVVQVYHVGEDEGTPFLTMELLQGKHLGHLIGSGLPAADVVRIGREVALGLAAAHKIGVVHRDIKPANVWIESPGGRVRLLDFGLARIADEASVALRLPPPAEAGLTQAGELVGTPMYMSPEQVDGEPVDFRTDLFSLGAVLYQMVTGRVPFGGKTDIRWADAIRTGAFTPVSEAAPATPPALARLIHALLAPRPADRPPSAAAVAEELLAIGTQLLIDAGSAAVPLPVSQAPAPEPEFDFTGSSERAERRRGPPPTRILLASATALVVAFLVIGVVQRVRKARQQQPPPVVDVSNPTPPDPNPLPKGFVSLFNGRDLSGWRPPVEGASDAWSVTDGALVGTPKQDFVGQGLLSDRDEADFELRLEYRWGSRGAHAAVLLRANDDKQRFAKGLAISIADDEGYPEAHKREIADGVRTGVVLEVTTKSPPANKPFGEWNALRVVARRHVIEVEVNGTRMPTANLDEKLAVAKARPELFRAKGPIGLTCWIGTVEYRNVIIKSLSQ